MGFSSVHPRVGGEHSERNLISIVSIGSSPRGRGTPSMSWPEIRSQRFIPAWAGNTVSDFACKVGFPVHPRVGGEHSSGKVMTRPLSGSSPRGRGTQWKIQLSLSCCRFIPAWAGNTVGLEFSYSGFAVHPRVGGEHSGDAQILNALPGSSPRGRGTRVAECTRNGNPRFIPAWAGNTYGNGAVNIHSPVHPRVGGEHAFIMRFILSPCGSSPRGRGTLID